ncbi:hypothetical protein [Flavobacterium sp. NRK1]|uniref:hypothetical protein n=1 Tax=Flavobacterium sp. NRK1 TaxID=2954929 RepID=UPI0020929922|nr:hypothetical protein [Flavobacterium sp. NRK1]MCO6146590.1 hypothetical protein [Flavobacterium sp. NRK1]
MKKLLLLLFLLTGISLFAQENNDWDEWQKTSCYSKISFRIKSEKKYGEQFHWKIQFKNDYPEVISFNYHVTDKLEQYNITTHRKTLTANQVSDDIEIFTKEDDIFLLVDKLSFSPYPEDLVDCDTN